MSAVWALARAGWRRSLGLILVVGLASGAVMALAAGARRTTQAYPRFLEAQRAFDVAIVNYPGDETAVFDFDELGKLDVVADHASGAFDYVNLGAGTGSVASFDGRIGSDINRFKLLEGRRLDPRRPEEVVVGFDVADRYGLRIGSRFPLTDPAELDNAPPEYAEQAAVIHDRIARLIPDGLKVVGIEASPGEFPPQFAATGTLVHVSPALAENFEWGENQLGLFRLKGGDLELAQFQRELERRSGGKFVQQLVQRDQTAAVQRSLSTQATALALLAALGGLTGALVLSQAFARATFLGAVDHPVLRALGMSTGQLTAMGFVRWAVIGAAGAALGSAVAVAASPLFPVGLARIAEPDPGVALDGLVLVRGFAGTVAGVMALVAIPVVRAASTGAATPRADRPSVATNAASGLGLPPAAVAGVRMALQRGRGRAAMPVATTIAGASIGIAALIAALTFGQSLRTLLDTPTLYGLRWHRSLTDYQEPFSDADLELVRSHPGVAAAGHGDTDRPVEINGLRVDAVVLDNVKGDVTPPIVAGRRPHGAGEIALGRRTLDKLGADVGDTVRVSFAGIGELQPQRVVGQVVLPALSTRSQLGDGALITGSAAAFLVADGDDPGSPEGAPRLFVRFAPGVDRDLVTAEIGAATGRQLYSPDMGKPTDIVNFGRVESTPFLLAVVLALIAVGTTAHALVSGVRRRRHELAILKTLGFLRRQVGAVVGWQATTVVALALLVGLPFGIAAGRWIWTVFAEQLGIVAQPHVPTIAVALIVPAAVLLANVIAAVPAWMAASTRPAAILRTE